MRSSLLVRERLTGAAPPREGARRGRSVAAVDRGRAGAVLDRMPELLLDQEAFGRLTRDLLAALDLADQLEQRARARPRTTEDRERRAERRRARRTRTRKAAAQRRPKRGEEQRRR